MRQSDFLLPLAVILTKWQFVSAVEPLVDLGYTKVQGAAQSIGATQWLGVRYAAPPLGALRFAAPVDITTNGTGDGSVVDATKFAPICLPRSASDFTMQPNKRFSVSEDCLFLNIFAPSNATTASALPVMYFIQGGGFQSLSNANFNGSELANFGNMVVVQVNYRVGPFGFLHSKEVKSGGSLNNGLKDQIMGLQWLKQHVNKFGGNPDQMVMVGDSAGATSVALLLTAFAGQDPKTSLVKGAIMESVSVATLRTLDQGQEQYACLLNATSCTQSADTLACLRSANASQLQTDNCQFNPNLDGELITAPTLSRFDQGLYLRVPNIIGSCNDEGTKNVPKSANTTADALKHISNQAFGALSNASLELMNATYLSPDSPLPGNYNVSDTSVPVRASQAEAPAGRFWQQLAVAHGDYRTHCITARIQNAMARDGVKTYNYRFAVVDNEQEALGFGAYHTVELNAVFGANNTDGAPPKSYRGPDGVNLPIVATTMAYWASFVRSLDPNTNRVAGTPEWTPWTGPASRERLRFKTGDMGMESMGQRQMGNCEMVDPMLPAIETPLSAGIVVELNKPGGSFASSWGSSTRNQTPGIAAAAAASTDDGQQTGVVGKKQGMTKDSGAGSLTMQVARGALVAATVATLSAALL